MGIFEYRHDETKTIINRALKFAEDFFANDYSGHDFYHTLRVYHLANKIAEKEGGDREIISLAAILHDVDDKKLVGTPEKKPAQKIFHNDIEQRTFEDSLEDVDEEFEACPNARRFLRSNFYPEEVVDQICNIIERVSFSSAPGPEETLEGKIVQDADRLDALGAMSIARTFAYGGAHDRPIYLPETAENSPETSIQHFYDKILKLKDLMNTETAKKLAEPRHAFVKKFLEEFYKEWEV